MPRVDPYTAFGVPTVLVVDEEYEVVVVLTVEVILILFGVRNIPLGAQQQVDERQAEQRLRLVLAGDGQFGGVASFTRRARSICAITELTEVTVRDPSGSDTSPDCFLHSP